MIIFREKAYSSKDSVVRKLGRYIKKYPLLPISAASLTIAGVNLAQNRRGISNNTSLQEEQIKATKELTRALRETKVVLREAKAITKSNNKRN